jgi:oligopeptide/dipeptide ABC transporter ATP-binding protein
MELFGLVGLPNAGALVRAYPHEISGGMQQRVMIAMALASRPSLLVADEPTTALDVTLQAQILELLASLQARTRMGVLLITHNFGLVAERAQEVHVMYAGRVVESGPTERVLAAPAHPYTRGLLDAVPRLDGGADSDRGTRLKGVAGSVPNASCLPGGCRFHPRCPRTEARCSTALPPRTDMGGGQFTECWAPLGQC